MEQFTSFIILMATLLINTLSCCSAENVYCVAPNTTSCLSCPRSSTHCATLSEYAQESKLYFTSNTTIVFLPGDHVLDISIVVANVNRLTMRGEFSSGNVATVVRNGSVGFKFMNNLDLNIYFLAFTSFERRNDTHYFISYRRHPASNFALGLQSTQYAKLVKCSFHDNLGIALTVHNTSITLAENEFIHNQCGCQLITMHKLGCGITALNSNLTFTGNTSFHKNIAVGFLFCGCGGVIWASVSSLNFTGTSSFTDNVAYSSNSGVVYAEKYTSLSFTGISDFRNNSACAIYTSGNVVITFNGNSNFINNSAHFGYGVLHAVTNTSVSFIGASNFSHNTAVRGGAIYTNDNAVLAFNGTNNFFNNTAYSSGGGAISAGVSKLSFIGTSHFTHNLAISGGAIYAYENVVLTFNGTNNFFNNSAITTSGGAINAEVNTFLSFIGTSTFAHNWAKLDGGAMNIVENVVLTFNETSNFLNNSAVDSGGAICALRSIVLTFSGNNEFINNHVNEGNGGVIYTLDNVVLILSGTNNFFNNSAFYGGAIDAGSKSLTFLGTTNFSYNWAKHNGGAINVFTNVVLNFTGISNFFNNSVNQYHGGAVCASKNVVLTFTGGNTFIGNSAYGDGGALFASSNASLSFVGPVNFTYNSANSGGAVATVKNVVITYNETNDFINNSAKSDGGAIFAAVNISLSLTGNSCFSNNSALQGGAISANINSKLTFHGDISFSKNGHNADKLSNSHGGAIYLAIRSIFFILPHTIMSLENNHANLGGAIYVLNANPFIYCTRTRISRLLPREKCFFQLPGGLDLQLVFKNNSADDAGRVLYGGAIDNCKLTGLNSQKVFDMLVHYEDDDVTSSISSDPFQLCLCEKNYPNCSKSHKTLSVYPGETFQISVVAIGQRNGVAPAAVGSRMNQGRLLYSQYVQQTTKTCTTLNYTVFSKQDVSIELYPSGPCSTRSNKLFLQLRISQSCPPGFSLDKMTCICEQTLQQYTNHCNITNGIGRITRDSGDKFWVGYDQSQDLVIVHPHCPFDYCVSHGVIFSLNSSLSDVQCKHNRSGFLCGACKKDYSLVLGSSQCMRCTNNHLALLILFAVMGVALVFLLLVCKLTVATGTLSGLVFYANMVGINHNIFLRVNALSVFIAWLNLDFGIETCFYDGLNAYSKTWLQFVFPLFIWALVGLMIVISHFSQRFANLLGSNPVSVLATLILLSYTKILRTLITAVYLTHLEYPAYKRSVWLHDASVDYVTGKHVPLFLMAVLFFLFLFLPYTLLLLFGQWLQAISHLRLFSWVNSPRLKPFMDAYHAPYKAKHRYWPGLLLVLRFALLLVFALNPQQDPNINLLVILLGSAILQLWAWISGGVYKNWCLDALEGTFALNLIVLCVATYHIKLSGGDQLAVGYTSVSTALAMFNGILGYHMFQQLKHTKLWKKAPKLKIDFLKRKNTNKAAVNQLNNYVGGPAESVNLDQFREPWLEDLLQPTHSSF